MKAFIKEINAKGFEQASLVIYKASKHQPDWPEMQFVEVLKGPDTKASKKALKAFAKEQGLTITTQAEARKDFFENLK